MSDDSDLRKDSAIEERPLPAVIRAIDWLGGAASYLASAAIVLLVVCVFIDVIGRKFFATPFTGTLEMTANWWMPTLTLMAFAFTEQMQEHIKVTILLDALPLRMRQLIEGWFGILATLLLVGLAYFALQDAMKAAAYGQTTASTPPIVIWPFKFVAVAGISLLALQFAATSYRYFAGLLPHRHEYVDEAELG